MRILLLTPDFPPAPGGIQRLLARLAANLEGHEVVVATPSHPGDREHDRVFCHRVIRVGSCAGRHADLAACNALAPLLAVRLRADALISGHIVCAAGALAARRLLGAPVLQYVYAQELCTRAALARAVLPRVDTTVAVSDYSASLARNLGAVQQRVAVVRPGVDPPSPELPGRGPEPVVLTVARLEDRYKGFDVMLRALPLVLARVPQARWVILGEGPLRAELEQTVRRAGLDAHVRLLGAVSDAARDYWLSRAHVFAMPSRVPPAGAGEGFGLVFLEAARLGLACVTGRQGGGAEAVVDGVTGTLVDPLDHVELADAITELLLDEGLRARYGASAREHATVHSWQAMGAAVAGLIERLVAGARGGRAAGADAAEQVAEATVGADL